MESLDNGDHYGPTSYGVDVFFVTVRSKIRKNIKDSMYYNDNFAKKNKVRLLPSIQAR